MVQKMKLGSMMPLFFVVLFSAVAVSAQPLGFGSSKTGQSENMVLSSTNGRFVFGQISNSGKDQFMLDTATGRLWQIGETGKIGVFLKSIPYRNEKGECSLLPDEILGPVQKMRKEK
jgi:hypothetical protein